MASQKSKWTRGQIEVLIEAYREERCLYEATHPNYHNKTLRMQALQRVCDTLQLLRPGVDEKECQAKFQNLRTQFNVEQAKCRNSKKCGVELADRYVPSLWYYPLLQFLEEYCGSRRRNKSPRCSDTQSFLDTQDIGSACSDAYLEELELPGTSLMTTQQAYRIETPPTGQDPEPATPAEPHSAASSSKWKSKKRRIDDIDEVDDKTYAKVFQALTRAANAPISIDVNNATTPTTSIDPLVQTFSNFIAQLLNAIECPTTKLGIMAQVVEMAMKARMEDEDRRRSNTQ